MMEVYYDLSRLVERLAAPVASGIDRIDLHYALWTRAAASRWVGVVQRPWGVECLDDAYVDALLNGLDQRWIGGSGGSGQMTPPPRWRRETLAAILEKVGHAPLRSRMSGRSPLAVPFFLFPTLTQQLLHLCCSPLRAPDERLSGSGIYWNIGHNFRFERAAEAIAGRWGARSVVFLHDVIPLLEPATQRVVSRLHFLRFCQWVDGLSGQLIVSARATKAALGQLEGVGYPFFGRTMGSLTQLSLPVEASFVDASASRLSPEAAQCPYFLIIGTWEPRRNFNLLLEVWEQLALAGGPKVVLKWVAQRGELSRKTAARLKRLQQAGWVEVMAGVSDRTMVELFSGARALLFPSVAEGWGLPLAEALAAGLPVIASDLPICREVSQGLATYLPVDQPSQWLATVQRYAAVGSTIREKHCVRIKDFRPMTWEGHFEALRASTVWSDAVRGEQ